MIILFAFWVNFIITLNQFSYFFNSIEFVHKWGIIEMCSKEEFQNMNVSTKRYRGESYGF